MAKKATVGRKELPFFWNFMFPFHSGLWTWKDSFTTVLLPSKLQDCSKNGSVEGGFQGPRRIVGESIAKTMKIYTGWGRLKYLHQMLQYVRVEAYKFRTIQVVSEQIAPIFDNHIII
jgi:hypothetical protein